ncbi:hypothetical protein VTK73DRAFT_5970 [Phialemonium thermophilum]|uniref:Uncharacterized protein n=1 Tax=Phialemonium thermophilum TaxID=223376 RepID=A0ABR3V0C9_9PEZI
MTWSRLVYIRLSGFLGKPSSDATVSAHHEQRVDGSVDYLTAVCGASKNNVGRSQKKRDKTLVVHSPSSLLSLLFLFPPPLSPRSRSASPLPRRRLVVLLPRYHPPAPPAPAAHPPVRLAPQDQARRLLVLPLRHARPDPHHLHQLRLDHPADALDLVPGVTGAQHGGAGRASTLAAANAVAAVVAAAANVVVGVVVVAG